MTHRERYALIGDKVSHAWDRLHQKPPNVEDALKLIADASTLALEGELDESPLPATKDSAK